MLFSRTPPSCRFMKILGFHCVVKNYTFSRVLEIYQGRLSPLGIANWQEAGVLHSSRFHRFLLELPITPPHTDALLMCYVAVAFRHDTSMHLHAWTHRDGPQRNAWKTHPCGAGLRLRKMRHYFHFQILMKTQLSSNMYHLPTCYRSGC